MAQHVNHFVTVHGPGLVGPGPFGGPPYFDIVDPDEDVVLEDGDLQITVSPRTTDRGVTVEKVVRFPRGTFTHVTVSRTTRED